MSKKKLHTAKVAEEASYLFQKKKYSLYKATFMLSSSIYLFSFSENLPFTFFFFLVVVFKVRFFNWKSSNIWDVCNSTSVTSPAVRKTFFSKRGLYKLLVKPSSEFSPSRCSSSFLRKKSLAQNHISYHKIIEKVWKQNLLQGKKWEEENQQLLMRKNECQRHFQ